MHKKPTISWSDFEKIDLRVGQIVDVQSFPEAKKPAFKLWVDFGALGTLKSSAQITDLYTPEELIGTQVIAIVNFEPKQIGRFLSECLIMGIYSTDNKVVLLRPNSSCTPGEIVG